jgi:precorrin-6A/cobalt-precorrin-6A reductase
MSMSGKRILIFGGTGEARELASLLVNRGYDVTTSLAGVTGCPRLPDGSVVRGGLGGAKGIAAYVARETVAAIIDATHPFAARISQHVYGAAVDRGIPYLRLERPAWAPEAGDHWTEIASIEKAVAAIPQGARVMLTVGRKEAAAFLARPDLGGLVRMIETPDCDIPMGWTLIRERPPFTIECEMALIDAHRITVLVSKNSGGDQTRSKLIAARERKIPVVIVARPVKPDAPVVAEPAQLIPVLDRLLNS